MAAIARGTPNTTAGVNWFITINGALADAAEVGFRILDISSGLPGTQVFPATPGTYQDVTNAPGKFSTGSYYAYDPAVTAGWTPSLAEPLGTHRVEWRWKATALSSYQTGVEDFEVVPAEVDSGTTYITVQDIRDEGVTTAVASDGRVQTSILTWQEFLDRACRQWFQPRTMTLKVDGNDSDTLFLGVPVISVEYIKLNNATDKLDPTRYRVYNNRSGFPDDRKNPRITLQQTDAVDSIFQGPVLLGYRAKFRRGRQNQEIKGVFGYTEADGTVPLLIKRALTLLVVEKLTKPIYVAAGSSAPTPPPPIVSSLVLEEETDGHRVKYGAPGGGPVPRKNGLSGITDNPEILDIIKLFRAPIGAATPAHWGY